MSNEEFDNLKEELMWEGSSVVMLSKHACLFAPLLTACVLKSIFAKINANPGPRCGVDTNYHFPVCCFQAKMSKSFWKLPWPMPLAAPSCLMLNSTN